MWMSGSTYRNFFSAKKSSWFIYSARNSFLYKKEITKSFVIWKIICDGYLSKCKNVVAHIILLISILSVFSSMDIQLLVKSLASLSSPAPPTPTLPHSLNAHH